MILYRCIATEPGFANGSMKPYIESMHLFVQVISVREQYCRKRNVDIHQHYFLSYRIAG